MEGENESRQVSLGSFHPSACIFFVFRQHSKAARRLNTFQSMGRTSAKPFLLTVLSNIVFFVFSFFSSRRCIQSRDGTKVFFVFTCCRLLQVVSLFLFDASYARTRARLVPAGSGNQKSNDVKKKKSELINHTRWKQQVEQIDNWPHRVVSAGTMTVINNPVPPPSPPLIKAVWWTGFTNVLRAYNTHTHTHTHTHWVQRLKKIHSRVIVLAKMLLTN